MFDRLERRHDFASEQREVLASQVGRQSAELEEAEQVADAEALAVVKELVAHGRGAADDGVGPGFDLLAVLDGDQEFGEGAVDGGDGAAAVRARGVPREQGLVQV